MGNKNYPLNSVKQIDNFKEMLAYTSEKYAENPAFTFKKGGSNVSISYRAFEAETKKLASFFCAKYKKGTKIAVIGENSYEWILTYFAAVYGGNVIVPLDKELPAPDLKNLIDSSGAEVFVYSAAYADVAAYLEENKAAVKQYIVMDDIPALMSENPEKTEPHQTDSCALAAILYTSGTTGMSKGVMLSQYNLTHNMTAAAELVSLTGRNLLVLPLHHSFGFLGCVLFMMYQGSEITINSSLKHILDDMQEYKPRNIFLVPLFVETFYKKIWDSAKRQGKDGLLNKLIGVSNFLLKIGVDARRTLFKSVLSAFGGELALIVTGGAPIDEKYIKGLRDFGINVLNGYGITECAPVVSVNRNDYQRAGSIGQILPCNEVMIKEPNEDGHGEICVKGANVMLGYYNNEEATKVAFEGEWFKTGDIGYKDKDGFLFISGRAKNLIILSNGKNVYPEEVEFAVINSIPYVLEVVVYAEGNRIAAEVYLDTKNDPQCAQRLNDDITALNKTMPPYKSIGKVKVRAEEFPKTTTKKIKRQNVTANSTENREA